MFSYEIVELRSLKKLNLSNNGIVALCSMDFGANVSGEMLAEVSQTHY
jgi:hypothetical protein